MPAYMNRDLILPPCYDPEAIFAFAMTYNGYEGLGSFDASADAAHARRCETRADVRNELFFACRAARHSGDDRFIELYAELRPHFERFIAEAG